MIMSCSNILWYSAFNYVILSFVKIKHSLVFFNHEYLIYAKRCLDRFLVILFSNYILPATQPLPLLMMAAILINDHCFRQIVFIWTQYDLKSKLYKYIS